MHPWELSFADGINSVVREGLEEHFKPNIEVRPNKFIWLGANRQFPAFTFYFKKNEHGLWRVHCYQYDMGEYANGNATVIIECTEDTWRSAGLEGADEAQSLAYCEALLAGELEGVPLISNNSCSSATAFGACVIECIAVVYSPCVDRGP